MDIQSLKSLIINELDSNRTEIYALSRRIHANPELGFKEFQASEWLTSFLAGHGFKIERSICDLPTAFRASYGQGGPVVAFLAEYDALPEIGHACGHNLIAASAVGAGLGGKVAADEQGGTVVVIGTPAEELYSGKMVMAEKGAFAGLDAALMVHPGGYDAATTYALACQGLDIEFFGRSAHAAAQPEVGINALEAMILSFNALNSLRQHIRSSARVHGIITDGGKAANVVPAHSAGNFLVRAADNKYLAELRERVLNCFRGAAAATGARLEYKWEEHYYAAMLNNLALGRLFVDNMRQLGRTIELESPDKGFGSTDFGNVSQIVPGMHGGVGILEQIAPAHTPEFAAAAVTDTALNSMLDAAKALAMVFADLASTPALVEEVRAEFVRSSRL